MNIDELVFDTYVICPFCKAEMKTLSGSHLIYKHGFKSMKDFKLEFGLPMTVPLISHQTRERMREKGKRRSDWFKENVMPIGIEFTKKHGDLVPDDIRKNSGKLRRNKSWYPELIEEMKGKGLIDLHEAASILDISYNYTRKCATDGRLKVEAHKGVRFTKAEWIEDTRKLLEENRIKYHKK